MDLSLLHYACGGVALGLGIGFFLPKMYLVRALVSHVTNQSPKMVFVVRNDLKMGKGKIASQCAHAAVQCYVMGMKSHTKMVESWLYTGQAKVVLRTDSLSDLQSLSVKAKSLGLICCTINDAGRTQLEPGTPTVLGIGPGSPKDIDHVTSHLKLL